MRSAATAHRSIPCRAARVFTRSEWHPSARAISRTGRASAAISRQMAICSGVHSQCAAAASAMRRPYAGSARLAFMRSESRFLASAEIRFPPPSADEPRPSAAGIAGGGAASVVGETTDAASHSCNSVPKEPRPAPSPSPAGAKVEPFTAPDCTANTGGAGSNPPGLEERPAAAGSPSPAAGVSPDVGKARPDPPGEML